MITNFGVCGDGACDFLALSNASLHGLPRGCRHSRPGWRRGKCATRRTWEVRRWRIAPVGWASWPWWRWSTRARGCRPPPSRSGGSPCARCGGPASPSPRPTCPPRWRWRCCCTTGPFGEAICGSGTGLGLNFSGLDADAPTYWLFNATLSGGHSIAPKTTSANAASARR